MERIKKILLEREKAGTLRQLTKVPRILAVVQNDLLIEICNVVKHDGRLPHELCKLTRK